MAHRSKRWLIRHFQVFFDTLGRLSMAPISTLMTVSVIAVAVTLPMLLLKLVDNAEEVIGDWGGRAELSVFLRPGSDGVEIDPIEVGERVLQIPIVEDVEYVSPERGAAEFAQIPGFSDAIDILPHNPIPPLLIVYPLVQTDQSGIAALIEQVGEMEGVDRVIFDQKWLHRFVAMVHFARQGAVVLTVLMGLGIVLVIGNQVRLGISQRATEIEVISQVGGTDGFIRRPFLYMGAMQCCLGAILAWLIANVILWWLSAAVSELAGYYDSEFSLGWIGVKLAGAAMVICVLLGLGASRITVDKYLWRLRPK